MSGSSHGRGWPVFLYVPRLPSATPLRQPLTPLDKTAASPLLSLSLPPVDLSDRRKRSISVSAQHSSSFQPRYATHAQMTKTYLTLKKGMSSAGSSDFLDLERSPFAHNLRHYATLLLRQSRSYPRLHALHPEEYDCICTTLASSFQAVLSSTEEYKKHASDLSSTRDLALVRMRESKTDFPSAAAWREVYYDCALSLALCKVLRACEHESDEYWIKVIEGLDSAIIVAGFEFCRDAVDLISLVQAAHLPPNKNENATLSPPKIDDSLLPSASVAISSFMEFPSLSKFRSELCKYPFIIRNAAADWPALADDRKWASKAYLQQAAGGRGRFVPVEVGRDYRTDDWTQRIESYDDFLNYIFLNGYNDDSGSNKATPVKYLAQYDLLSHFPKLRDDIIIPDYVYALPDPPPFSMNYHPPAGVDGLVLSAWLGPQGTMSPAHIDPHFNIYSESGGFHTPTHG